ncbi:MAG: DUF2721 domain-containing protein [Burkholderiales bacterium]|nr:DUF2721 domain-containing protein [Burkholderiales bacterium]
MALISKQAVSSLDAFAHVVQLAIAPVFLLTAVGTLLMVLTSRLGRAVDRRRVLERQLEEGAAGAAAARATTELGIIARRVALIYRAIVLAVFGALFICLLIGMAFIDAFLATNLTRGLGVLFVLAMLALIGALTMFLREIFIAVDTPKQTAGVRDP